MAGPPWNGIFFSFLGEDQRTVDKWFDTAAFVAAVRDPNLSGQEQARRSLGNSAENPLRYDGVPLVDISLHKEFVFGEEKSFDFRVDFFNAFNHPVFGAPNGNMAATSAGRVTDAATARQIQFGFRFSF